MTRIILDTDPGVDDALAIILAVCWPDVKVEAITTVAGNVPVEQATRNVFRILDIVNPRERPIVAQGADKPLQRPLFTATDVFGADGLGELDTFLNDDGTKRYPEPIQQELSPVHAVDLILDLVVQHPGEITIISVGPATNVAMALSKSPERMQLVKQIVKMGSKFNVKGNTPNDTEFNVYNDPHAFAMLLDSGLPIVVVPLDVTYQVKLMRSHVEQLHRMVPTRLSQFICDFTHFNMRYRQEKQGFLGTFLHDPLAVSVAVDPRFVKMCDAHIEVETVNEHRIGKTVVYCDAEETRERVVNAKVCTAVDAPEFLKFFFSTIYGVEPIEG